ncbi:MAG TPA: hypothetical protein VIG47_06995, partial [Gemmatimonadaceae bacterium]
LAEVGLGLLGVWTLLSAVEAFIQIAAIVGASFAPLGIAEVIPVGLSLILSYLLIFHNAKVATAIFPDVEATTDVAASDVARTLVALTGVMLVVQAMPGAVNIVLNMLPIGGIEPRLRAELLNRSIRAAIPIAAGVYLIMRPGRLLEYLQRPLPEHNPSGE